MMIKVLIADDQELIRESLEIVLNMNPDMEVIGVAENGAEVLQFLKKQQPDVILMDVRMPEIDGVQCTNLIKEKYPKIKIIILTTFDDDEYVYNALKYGASGYLLKGVSVTELSNAIRAVVSGGAMINPNIITKVVKLFSEMAQNNFAVKVEERGVEELTRTERKAVCQVGRGLSNREIAGKLNLSEGTVRNNLSTALSKLNLRDRTQLAIWAVQTGMVQKSEPEE
ncbi:DNA-binding NarL/FixJ family response regulator [Sporomusaceae bacterium BoRhaA]|uniref:response regulator transcription factor n=1 Tax=Pelorhabdus rhamnosifermentans TaxID=2772457 RepID=UPI001FE39739|nr:response regulator transcription factor [Pelorhabdus rhamnosifermentans]MBU2701375.1 DNA-binding NarL/FixJ family response regulator [Pelorhabdus rhamnosifermentans]